MIIILKKIKSTFPYIRNSCRFGFVAFALIAIYLFFEGDFIYIILTSFFHLTASQIGSDLYASNSFALSVTWVFMTLDKKNQFNSVNTSYSCYASLLYFKL